MAAPLDVATTTSSADAFKHPLLSVKHFQRQLNATLEEKNGRLRTLVGGSYRQLLVTAEMIVEMRREIETVEADLGQVAERCGKSAVVDKVSGLAELEKRERTGAAGVGLEKWGLGSMAKMKALDGCVIAVGRLLKGKEGGPSRGPRFITAAMVLVLARLLLNNLTIELKTLTNPTSVAALLEDTKKKVGTLDKRLLRSLRKMIQAEDEDENRQELASALCAYSLATNSSLKNVVHWFLLVRGEGIVMSFEAEENESPRDAVLRAMKLYTRALQDVQLLAPKKLSEALQALKSKSLLKNQQIRELDSLRLDVCERWFGDNILYFTPFISHDDLDLPQVKDMLRKWSEKASAVLLDGLKKTLSRISDLRTVKELRTLVLEQWISESSKIKGHDASILLDDLRQSCLDRMIQQVQSRASKLHLVSAEIQGTLDTWQPGVSDKLQSLWDQDVLDMDISNGAGLFKQELLARTHGRNDNVSRVVTSYQSWRRLVKEVAEIISQLRSQKWDDDLEEDLEDTFLESRSMLLSKDDPDSLQEHLDTSLLSAFTELHGKLSGLLTEKKDDGSYGPFSIFIIRAIRDIRDDLPNHPELRSWGLDLVPGIHDIIASVVAKESIERFAKSSFRREKIIGRALWEGSPELPSQPSPAAFRFLRSLTSSMTTTGSDLWSSTAVVTLKRHVVKEVGTQWQEAIASSKSGVHSDSSEKETNGTGKDVNGDAAETISREIDIQAVFDVLILKHSLSSTKVANTKELDDLLDLLYSRLKFESALKERMAKAASEYWLKISLLFGLLS